jgi:hypothetical protein
MPSSSDSTPDAASDARVAPGRVLRESLPIAGITAAWVALSWVAGHPAIGTGARYAGVVMAGTYAVVRGATLARTTAGVRLPDRLDGTRSTSAWLVAARSVPPALLRGNVAAVLAGGAWLLAARVVLLVESAWNGFGLPGLFVSPARGLVFALTATGVLTVLLVAVTVALSLARPVEPIGSGVAPTDD